MSAFDWLRPKATKDDPTPRYVGQPANPMRTPELYQQLHEDVRRPYPPAPNGHLLKVSWSSWRDRPLTDEVAQRIRDVLASEFPYAEFRELDIHIAPKQKE